jgi:heat shock protein HtpX
MKTHYHLIDDNKTKSWLVIAGFISFISIATYLIVYALGGDMYSVLMAVVVSSALSIGSYYYSDQIILSISGAVPANKRDHFDFYTVTENLVRVAGVPMPKLYVIQDTAMNAFATGRDPKHAVVCATTGLLSRLDRGEVEAVVAHELAHVKNYDIRLMSIVTVLVGMITLLADWLLRFSFGRKRDDRDGNLGMIMFIAGLVLALLSPIIAQIIQLAISRRREFLADATGASFTRHPEGLARALEKISHDKEPLEAANKATAHLYISNPLKNHPDSIGWFANMFSTHPPVKERIAALRGLKI